MRKWIPVLALVLLSAGCSQKLNHEQTYEVPMGLTKEIIFTAPAYSQNVTVSIKPESCAVSAYLIKAKDKDAVEAVLNKKQVPESNLVFAGRTFDRKAQKEDYELSATIPARTEFMILFNGGRQRTNVKVKVVGK
jgi:hypothetical protein